MPEKQNRPYSDSASATCLTSSWGVLQRLRTTGNASPSLAGSTAGWLGTQGLVQDCARLPFGWRNRGKNPKKAGLDVPLPLVVKHALRCDYLRGHSGESCGQKLYDVQTVQAARSLIWVRQENPSASMVRSGAALAFARILDVRSSPKSRSGLSSCRNFRPNRSIPRKLRCRNRLRPGVVRL